MLCEWRDWSVQVVSHLFYGVHHGYRSHNETIRTIKTTMSVHFVLPFASQLTHGAYICMKLQRAGLFTTHYAYAMEHLVKLRRCYVLLHPYINIWRLCANIWLVIYLTT
jgi:hypothetical protein